MKRRFGLTLVVFLLLVSMFITTAQAATETIDLSQLSDEEIVSLMDQVNNEIVRRGIEKTAKLSKGTYIVGVDIPAGKYIYTCLAQGDDWGSVTVYADKGQGDQLLWEVVSAPEEGNESDTVFLDLHEGEQLKSGVPFSLTVQAGIKFS